RVARSDASGVRLELARGRVALHAEKRPRNAPLVIVAGGVEVEVVGTVFSLDTARAGLVVAVGEGLVEVRAPQETVRLGPGEQWRSSTLRRDAVDEESRRWSARSLRVVADGVPLTLPAPPSVKAPVLRTPARSR